MACVPGAVSHCFFVLHLSSKVNVFVPYKSYPPVNSVSLFMWFPHLEHHFFQNYYMSNATPPCGLNSSLTHFMKPYLHPDSFRKPYLPLLILKTLSPLPTRLAIPVTNP